MSITDSPPAMPPLFASPDEYAQAILHAELTWQAAAAMIEACTIAFCPHESKRLLPMIRRILESEVVVREFVRTTRERHGNPRANLNAGCARLLQAASCQLAIRSGRHAPK